MTGMMLFRMLSLVILQATWGVTPLAKPELLMSQPPRAEPPKASLRFNELESRGGGTVIVLIGIFSMGFLIWTLAFCMATGSNAQYTPD